VGKIGGWSYDVARDKVYWTDVTRELHEVDSDYEPTVKQVIEFYKEGESRNRYFEVGMNAVTNGTNYDEELQIITAKGKELWVRAIGKTELKDGVCTRLYGTFQDIDSFKKVEIELKESGKLLKNLSDHIPGCLYQYELCIDGTFRLPYISQGITQITGFPSEEIRKNPNLMFENIHPDDLARVQNSIAESFASLREWKCDYRFFTADKQEKWLRGISSPEKEKDAVMWYGFLQEIKA
jgi:PAS domain-containing protein